MAFELPLFSEELIEQLEKENPPYTPDIQDSERKIWIKVGERRLVEQLKQRLEKTKEKDRKNNFVKGVK
jgi:hypothetical protein